MLIGSQKSCYTIVNFTTIVMSCNELNNPQMTDSYKNSAKG